MRSSTRLLPIVVAALLAGCAAPGANCPACPQCPEPTPSPSPAEAAGPEVVARVGDLTITRAELDEDVGGRVGQMAIEHLEQVYEIERNALEAMIDDRLVRAEAKAAGQSVGDYLEAQIKPEPVDEKLLKLAYDENAEAIGRPYDEVAPMMRAELEARARRTALEQFLAGLRERAGVKILLPKPEKPRFEVVVAEGEPVRGPADATVTIVTYSDFECPYCARGSAIMHEVLEKYPRRVRLVFRNFPLSFHANAQKAAEAGLCAHAQGKFWELHDKMFASRDALAVEQIKGYAAELGLDAKTFDACLDGGDMADQVDSQMTGAQKLGVQGTPAFFVNGVALTGALPVEDFVEVIEAELSR